MIFNKLVNSSNFLWVRQLFKILWEGNRYSWKWTEWISNHLISLSENFLIESLEVVASVLIKIGIVGLMQVYDYFLSVCFNG